MRALVVIALIVVAACTRGEHRAAREKYNEGVELLVKGEHEAAEKALLDARSAAGVDPELRFRAAYDLGMAYAAHAEKVKTGKDADLAKALELEQQAVSWFSDARAPAQGRRGHAGEPRDRARACAGDRPTSCARAKASSRRGSTR